MATANRAQKRAIKKLSLKKREPEIVAEVEVEAGLIRLAKADTVMTVEDLESIGDLESEDVGSDQIVALLSALCADAESKVALKTLSLGQLEELMNELDGVLGEESPDSPKQ